MDWAEHEPIQRIDELYVAWAEYLFLGILAFEEQKLHQQFIIELVQKHEIIDKKWDKSFQLALHKNIGWDKWVDWDSRWWDKACVEAEVDM